MGRKTLVKTLLASPMKIIIIIKEVEERPEQENPLLLVFTDNKLKIFRFEGHLRDPQGFFY